MSNVTPIKPRHGASFPPGSRVIDPAAAQALYHALAALLAMHESGVVSLGTVRQARGALAQAAGGAA